LSISAPELLLGSRLPRVRYCPPYTDTLGLEAIELAASAGLIADDWQGDSINDMLSLRPDGLWNCPEYGLIVPRQNGKGTVFEIRAVSGLYLLGERLIMWSAHEYKTAMEGFRRVLDLITNADDMRKRVFKVSNTNGDEGIELHGEGTNRITGRQRLRFIARSKGSGRGFSGDCNLLDEWFAGTDEQVAALLPTISARPNPQLVYASSPPLDAATGEPLFKLRRRALTGTDPALGWADWGAAQGTNLDDRREWARSNPAYNIRIPEETVARERRSMNADGFGRERMGIWPETAGDKAISQELWDGLVTTDQTAPIKSALLIDVSPDRKAAAIVGAGLMPNGQVKLRVWGYWSNTSTIVQRAAELKAELKPDLWLLHGKSSAATFIDDLAAVGIEVKTVKVKTEGDDEDRPVRGSLVVMSPEQEALAWGRFVDMVREELVLHHEEDVPLNVALAGAKTRPVGAGTAWARRGGADITTLVAATGATWGVATIELAEPESEPSAYWI